MPITAVIQIGNSDDRLSQAKWSMFISQLKHWLERNCEQIHFAGCSPGSMPWQNACFVVTLGQRHSCRRALRECLSEFAAKYEQGPIALIEGTTEFIFAKQHSKPAVGKIVTLPPGWPWSMVEDWQYSNWTIDCFSQLHDEATLFNRNDPITTTRSGYVRP